MTTRLLILLLLTLGPIGCSAGGDGHVNGSIRVTAGEPAVNQTTVNGSISLEENANAAKAETVNGNITLHAHASAKSVEAVNGSVFLRDGAHVAGSVELVNGDIELEKATDVGGALTNVNGSITLDGAHVAGRITTANGNINIGSGSHVDQGILIEGTRHGWFNIGSSGPPPRIVIGPDATVQGTLKFERKVILYVSDRASIGPVEGATAVRFSGDRPPG